ncbi:hypothetical protein EV421DRAFT_1910335 [Armillaria borealis]|uniref:Uncharacterized protein n=1 Tax=Armillaria borealis TaxID=47425 RepID=A0AA39J0D3_9AGAR|nr:hypothetical protein EV421DRAFT_1910335 [Armillaria borealis]
MTNAGTVNVDGDNQESDVMPADTAIVDPEHDDQLFPPIVLPPFPKGWAKGSRETLLDSCQVTFSYRHTETYYWDDPEDQEPTGPPPLPHEEVLTPQRKALKAAKLVRLTNAIYNWLNYRWKYPKNGPSPANSRNPKSEDPLHLLLCSVSGVDIRRSRALTAVEHWSKDHFEEIKRELEGETTAEGRSHIGTTATATRKQFASLPEDVKKRYKALAKEEGKQAREAKQSTIENAGALLSPSEAQLALN